MLSLSLVVVTVRSQIICRIVRIGIIAYFQGTPLSCRLRCRVCVAVLRLLCKVLRDVALGQRVFRGIPPPRRKRVFDVTRTGGALPHRRICWLERSE